MRTSILVAATLTLGTVTANTADAGPHQTWDRIEDRIDRRESIRDERVDLGRLDVIEDKVDRIESRRDRAGKKSPRKVSAWERRSWKKRRGRN